MTLLRACTLVIAIACTVQAGEMQYGITSQAPDIAGEMQCPVNVQTPDIGAELLVLLSLLF